MLTRRIIPCLDVHNGRVVKGVQFQKLRDAGNPRELAAQYESSGADELVLLDVSATLENRRAHLRTVERVRDELSIPLTVGGGVRTIEDAAALLSAGADKVGINTAAVVSPACIGSMAERFGVQCVVLAIDAARVSQSNRWEVMVRSGSVRRTNCCAVEWARRGQALGAGEVLLTSHDRDGTRCGYDLDLLRAVRDAVDLPLIASGGAASPADLLHAIRAGADAVLAASIFHDGDYTVRGIKRFLSNSGVEIRL